MKNSSDNRGASFWLSGLVIILEHIPKYQLIQALLAARRLLKFGIAEH
jgi:hypothetical protein